MSYFEDLIEKIIIFFCCLAIFLCQPDLSSSVVPVLITIIFSGFLSYFDDARIKTGITIGFAVLSCFMPNLTIFIPLIAYDMFFHKYQAANVFSIIPLLNFYRNASLQTSVIVTTLLILCLLIRFRMEALTGLKNRYNNLNDTAKEMSGILEKQNNDLLEKQDFELNLATLNERNRIAREIHDNVGHLLSSALLQSGALLTINQDQKVKGHLETLNSTLTQAMDSIRNSVHNLYDESIDLYAQVEELLKQFTFCEMSLDYQITNDPCKKLKYAFIAICKEALSNIIKHSNATLGSIMFREHPAFYQLIIRDNGSVKSFNTDNGLWLTKMRERVQSFNGHINIVSGKGFEIFISIPKEAVQF